ncbi:hypothetical protein F4775DRAFT_105783 [Biscogniauxia sp. FL1348]|nr:hypothetical protein F4775DRAFT_105783 [Biscogniauxia sp. FL1348]
MAFGLHPTEDKPADRAIFIDWSQRPKSFRTVTPDAPLGTARQSPTANGQLRPANVKMKATPQKPGPNGSRVIKRRPSYPRLGEGLASLLTKNNHAANDSGISGMNCESSVCAGDGLENHVPTCDPTTCVPAARIGQAITVFPEEEDLELTTSPTTGKLEKSGLNRTNLIAFLETPVAKNNVAITRMLESEQHVGGTAMNATAFPISPIQQATRVSSQEYDSLSTSSNNTPFDSLSTTSCDGVPLPSDTSISCTPHEDSEDESIMLYVKKRNSRAVPVNTPLKYELPVDSVEQLFSEPDFHTQLPDTLKSTRYISDNYGIHTAGALRRTIIFDDVPLKSDCEEIISQDPIFKKQQPSHQVTFDPATAKTIQDEANILNSYERGEITLPEAKRTAAQKHFQVLQAVLKERENHCVTASGKPTLTQCIKNMDEVNKRHADQVGLGQNIVPTSMPDLYPKWSNPVPCPPYQKSMIVSVEGNKLASFMGKLGSLSSPNHTTSVDKPVHIFVDMSNIFIGFCDSWKIARGIPVNQFIKAPTFNFKIFSSIMQRGRAAAKKILAGSVGGTVNERAKWPRHFTEAAMSGYEMNIFSRVQKSSPGKPKRRGRTSPRMINYTAMELGITSGDESPEEIGSLRAGTRHAEQGVDENLHLNMMNSMLDCMDEPETMVLATGDAAQAQFSGGFMEYATRALNRGWNLELITWKKTISSAWTAPAFLDKYHEQFRIIFLDDYLEELNADLFPCLAYGFESQWA